MAAPNARVPHRSRLRSPPRNAAQPGSRPRAEARVCHNQAAQMARQSTTRTHAVPANPLSSTATRRRAAACYRRPTARRSWRTDRSLSRRRLTCSCWTSSLTASQKRSAGWLSVRTASRHRGGNLRGGSLQTEGSARRMRTRHAKSADRRTLRTGRNEAPMNGMLNIIYGPAAIGHAHSFDNTQFVFSSLHT
jgi:hypothetical protein